MSLRTRIHGFTAWVNLRLKPSEQLMNNVLMDLLRGTSMKLLLQSLTGSEITRLQSFDNLTHDQKVIRVQWMVDELKKCKVIPDDVFVDTRLFAMRSAEHIFELLWRLVCHDIWFVWERAEYLQQDSDEVLAQVPFRWVPEAPPPKRKPNVKTTSSLLSGFASASILREELPSKEPDPMATYDPFPNSDFMKQFKTRTLEDGKYPPPEDCIMEMVNAQLMSVAEGRKVQCHTIDDLADSRVLCALVNSFVPNTFITEVLLNDRWTMNLVLRSTERMFYMHSPFDSEDLLEADTMSVCAFFCTFLMLAYKYRQSYSVVTWLDHIRMLRQQWEAELVKIPSDCEDEETTDHRDQVEAELTHINKAIKEIETNFDMEFCSQWLEHVDTVVKETHEEIRQKFRNRFETLIVPRSITVGHLCLSLGINLSLTNGSGFYLVEGSKKETLTETRRLVLQEKMTGDFFDDFTGKRKDIIRKLLGLPTKGSIDIVPEKYTFFKMFFEAQSKNKSLRFGSVFLYQVFPGNTVTWQKVYLRAVKDNELETVKRIVTFFRSNLAFINCQEPHTGNSTLHWACKLGYYDLVLYLLENGANIDQKNSSNQTALFFACDAWHKNIAHLLIEWGCDVHVKGPRGQTAFETVRNEEFQEDLISMYEMYSTWVPRVIEGDTELLAKLIKDHASGMRRFRDLRSRCINGSTLLHTAAYFGCAPLVRQLLSLGVDVNLRDYKGAAPLHRAKDMKCLKLLLNAGALPSALDTGHNTPLHVKCYGETDQASDTESVEVLLKAGAKLVLRNNRSLMPIHCAAMQGRTDLISMLLRSDPHGVIRQALAEEGTTAPPSVVYLAVANESLDCAEWLVQHNFEFKFDEEDQLLQKIVAEQITVTNQIGAVTFLLGQGVDINREFQGGNTLLHFAACMSGSTDVLELLMDSGASLDRKNLDGSGPLSIACRANNKFACSLLLDRGANIRAKNIHGMTAFDFVVDYEEWIECGYFNEEIRARLKAYSLKHARDLVRAITKKVKHPSHYIMKVPSRTSRNDQVSLVPWNPQGQRASSAGARGFPAFRKPPMKRQLGYLKAQ